MADLTEAEREQRMPLLMGLWKLYRLKVYPGGLVKHQEDECRRSFLGGFCAALGIADEAADDGPMGLELMLVALEDELTQVAHLEFPEAIEPPAHSERPH